MTKITAKNAELYETIEPLLSAMFKEVQDLSKKKPDGTLNLGKIKIINRLLEDIKILLQSEPSIKYLDSLDEENVPQYSDVALILSQYSAAMDAFRQKHYDGIVGWHTR